MNWIDPDLTPAEPGEYRAALDPVLAPDTLRRYWNGQNWSRPYHTNWPMYLQTKAKEESVDYNPFWLENK